MVAVVVMMVAVVVMMDVVVVVGGGCDGGVEMARIVTMTTHDDKMPVRTRAPHLQLAARCLHLLSQHLRQRQRHATSSPCPNMKACTSWPPQNAGYLRPACGG